MLKIFFPLLFVALCSAQPIPPDSVWTFAFDDDGDEFFYDAIEVDDGYILCGEAREWNALAGEALLVKIDLNGNLVWSISYDDDSHSRFRHFFASSHIPISEISVITDVVTAGGDPITVRQRLFHLDGTPYTFDGSICGVSPAQGYTKAAADVDWPRSAVFGVRQEILTGHRTNEDTLIQYKLGDDACYQLLQFGEYEIADAYSANGLAFSGICGKTIATTPGMATQAFFGLPGSTSYYEFGGDADDEFTCLLTRSISPQVWAFGWSESFTNGARDLWAVGYSFSPGVEPVSRHYGGLSNEDAVEAFEASNGGFIIAGNFSSEDIEFEQSDYWLLKVDENGDSVWSVLAGGEEADRCEGMIETQNGFLLFGASQSFTAPGWDACAMLLAYVPDLAAAPSTLNFGPVMVGDSAVRTLNLINTGSNTLTLNSIGGSVEYFSLFDGPVTVNIGDTLALDVYFAPTSAGARIDTLLIESDALSGPKSVRCLGAGVAAAADDQVQTPAEFALHPPYPNPFNAETVIEFALARESRASLELYDATGRLVRTLLDEDRPAGTHRILVNASGLPSGSYFVSLAAGSFHATQKMVVLK